MKWEFDEVKYFLSSNSRFSFIYFNLKPLIGEPRNVVQIQSWTRIRSGIFGRKDGLSFERFGVSHPAEQEVKFFRQLEVSQNFLLESSPKELAVKH